MSPPNTDYWGYAASSQKRGPITANVVYPGFVRTPLLEKQIPEQAAELGISEDDVVHKLILENTVDGEFTTAEVARPVFR